MGASELELDFISTFEARSGNDLEFLSWFVNTKPLKMNAIGLVRKLIKLDPEFGYHNTLNKVADAYVELVGDEVDARKEALRARASLVVRMVESFTTAKDISKQIGG